MKIIDKDSTIHVLEVQLAHTYEEMNKLQIEQKYKITARSALGVKNYATDDWIFSFNIGNILHLQTLGFDELANAKTASSMMKSAEATLKHNLLKAGGT